MTKGGGLDGEEKGSKERTLLLFSILFIENVSALIFCFLFFWGTSCSPHTGWQDYQNGVPKIPTACITVEDAELMARLVSRGVKIVVQLKMEAIQHPDADSFNTVAEIVGSKYPEQVCDTEETGVRSCQSIFTSIM